jgi:D-inositol-3-phosphate glycosyltransferase
MRLAVISAHTSPLAALGGKETGGMNVYVRETCAELGRRGWEVDVYTRFQDPEVPRVVHLAPGVDVHHVSAGPPEPYDKYRLVDHLPEFVSNILGQQRQGYDLIHSHYWISGMAALALRERWGVPVAHMYHTLGFIKNRVARTEEETEQSVRIAWEWDVARSADAMVASHPLEKAQLIWHYDAPSDRVKVIPCGVDLSLFKPMDREQARCALGLEPRPWLLFVGRLEPIKGLDTLLTAMSI